MRVVEREGVKEGREKREDAVFFMRPVHFTSQPNVICDRWPFIDDNDDRATERWFGDFKVFKPLQLHWSLRVLGGQKKWLCCRYCNFFICVLIIRKIRYLQHAASPFLSPFNKILMSKGEVFVL